MIIDSYDTIYSSEFHQDSKNENIETINIEVKESVDEVEEFTKVKKMLRDVRVLRNMCNPDDREFWNNSIVILKQQLSDLRIRRIQRMPKIEQWRLYLRYAMKQFNRCELRLREHWFIQITEASQIISYLDNLHSN